MNRTKLKYVRSEFNLRRFKPQKAEEKEIVLQSTRARELICLLMGIATGKKEGRKGKSQTRPEITKLKLTHRKKRKPSKQKERKKEGRNELSTFSCLHPV